MKETIDGALVKFSGLEPLPNGRGCFTMTATIRLNGETRRMMVACGGGQRVPGSKKRLAAGARDRLRQYVRRWRAEMTA